MVTAAAAAAVVVGRGQRSNRRIARRARACRELGHERWLGYYSYNLRSRSQRGARGRCMWLASLLQRGVFGRDERERERRGGSGMQRVRTNSCAQNGEPFGWLQAAGEREREREMGLRREEEENEHLTRLLTHSGREDKIQQRSSSRGGGRARSYERERERSGETRTLLRRARRQR